MNTDEGEETNQSPSLAHSPGPRVLHKPGEVHHYFDQLDDIISAVPFLVVLRPLVGLFSEQFSITNSLHLSALLHKAQPPRARRFYILYRPTTNIFIHTYLPNLCWLATILHRCQL